MSTTLYINHLGQIDLSELEYLFSSVGDVRTSRAEAQPGSTRGTRVGVIEMASEQQAADCIARFNGHEAFGQTLSVSSAMPVIRKAEVIDELKGRLKRRTLGKR